MVPIVCAFFFVRESILSAKFTWQWPVWRWLTVVLHHPMDTPIQIQLYFQQLVHPKDTPSKTLPALNLNPHFRSVALPLPYFIKTKNKKTERKRNRKERNRNRTDEIENVISEGKSITTIGLVRKISVFFSKR